VRSVGASQAGGGPRGLFDSRYRRHPNHRRPTAPTITRTSPEYHASKAQGETEVCSEGELKGGHECD